MGYSYLDIIKSFTSKAFNSLLELFDYKVIPKENSTNLGNTFLPRGRGYIIGGVVATATIIGLGYIAYSYYMAVYLPDGLPPGDDKDIAPKSPSSNISDKTEMPDNTPPTVPPRPPRPPKGPQLPPI